ncbi:unnamed protein product [Lactuca virosa]|uniref:Uncharacterized protein n=1 Tax=Lactuca virosa TaxID=75947 RepID=A0AAU9NDH4_9ASTR|nr:unnamed protein product [Lactuca virosa]
MIFNMCIMSIRYKYVRTEEDFIITTHHPIHCIALDVVMRFEGDGEVGVDLRSTTIQISTSSVNKENGGIYTNHSSPTTIGPTRPTSTPSRLTLFKEPK